LIATNYDLKPRSQNEFEITWIERILAADITTPHETIEFYNTYIPPGSSNRWKKIETLEGLYKGLAKHTAKKRILCGDFNTPQDELLKHGVCTFAQKINKKGVPKLKKIFRGGSGNRWDQGERNILEGLKEFDLSDAYRRIHPIPKKAYSFVIERRGKVVAKRRFDHFFLSKEFKIKSIEYLHQFRESGLSDHSPLELIVH
jgi:Exonuclease III